MSDISATGNKNINWKKDLISPKQRGSSMATVRHKGSRIYCNYLISTRKFFVENILLARHQSNSSVCDFDYTASPNAQQGCLNLIQSPGDAHAAVLNKILPQFY